MKTICLAVVFYIITFLSCQSNSIRVENRQNTDTNLIQLLVIKDDINNLSDTIIKQIKSFRQFNFSVSNKDTNCFGFEYLYLGPGDGVQSIALGGDYVYMSDSYHGNIKKINLTNGQIKSSNILDDKRNLGMLAIFNNRIYAFTGYAFLGVEKVFILDLELNKYNEFLINCETGEKKILYQTYDTIALMDDYIMLRDTKKSIVIGAYLIKITSENQIIKDSVFFEDYKSFFNELEKQPNIRIVKYKEIKEDSFHYLINKWGKYELNEQIPTTSKYLDGENIDFTENRIVYYSVTPNDVTLTVYEY